MNANNFHIPDSVHRQFEIDQKIIKLLTKNNDGYTLNKKHIQSRTIRFAGKLT